MANITKNQSSKMGKFHQDDPNWGHLELGTARKTIAEIGCTLTCIGMCIRQTPKTMWNSGFKNESVN